MGRAPNSDKNGLKKGPWTSEEDQKLVDYIKTHGYGNWRTLPINAGLQRCGKSCRLRWTNYLRPDIKRGKFTHDEEEIIIHLHSILGNKWSCIAARLPGRTDNEIKNYWNTHIRKKLLMMGIDPVTHNPRLDLLDLSSIISSSLFNPSQMNMSRLLGIEPFANPALLKLATSILSSSSAQKGEEQNMFLQNGLENQMASEFEYKNQFEQLAHSNQLVDNAALNCNNFTYDRQESDQLVEQFSPSTLINFGSHNPAGQLNECQQGDGLMTTSILNQDYVNDHALNYDYYDGSNQINMDNQFDDISNFKYSNNHASNQDFSFTSMLSTPSSASPTPTEDERESRYCSNNMLKFELPDNIFDHISEFIM